MGVRGLSSYLQHRPDLWTNCQLGDSTVIIDANNIKFELYNRCPGINDCFGGDYDKAAELNIDSEAKVSETIMEGFRPVDSKV